MGDVVEKVVWGQITEALDTKLRSLFCRRWCCEQICGPSKRIMLYDFCNRKTAVTLSVREQLPSQILVLCLFYILYLYLYFKE